MITRPYTPKWRCVFLADALCTFDYYEKDYHGTEILTEESFSRLENRAESLLRVHTGEVTHDLSLYPEVKDCLCELCDLFAVGEKTLGIKSETTDGLSITVSGDPSSSRRVSEVIRRRLFRTGLLYRGIPLC